MQSIEAAAGRLGRITLRLLDAAIIVLTGTLLAVVVSEFIDRNLIDLWTFSPEEYVKILLVWLCFLGVARAFAGGDAIRVTFIYELLPRPVRIVVSAICNLLVLATLAVMIVKTIASLPIARLQMILGTDFTVAVPTWGLLVGLVLLVPVFGIALLRNLRGHEDASTGAAGIE